MDINKKEVGARIKFIRISLGLTMEEFGERVGKALKSNVSKWERGDSLPNNARLKQIAELGQVSMLYLLEGKKTVTDLSEVEKQEFFQEWDKKERNRLDALKKSSIASIRDAQLESLSSVKLNAIDEYIKLLSNYSNNTSIVSILEAIPQFLNSFGMDDYSDEKQEKRRTELEAIFSDLLDKLDEERNKLK